MVRINFPNHAKTRCIERGIDPFEVIRVVKGSAKTKKGEGGRMIKKESLDDGKILEIVYDEKKELRKKTKTITIITAYYED